jgi:hypothetical protein
MRYSMTSFKKPPLTTIEKERKAEEFINYVAEITPSVQTPKIIVTPKKEATKTVILRMPESFKYDINEITSFTGLSFNAVCLELLRPAIKKKLKELKED